jgi:hypothetical protein
MHNQSRSVRTNTSSAWCLTSCGTAPVCGRMSYLKSSKAAAQFCPKRRPSSVDPLDGAQSSEHRSRGYDRHRLLPAAWGLRGTEESGRCRARASAKVKTRGCAARGGISLRREVGLVRPDERSRSISSVTPTSLSQDIQDRYIIHEIRISSRKMLISAFALGGRLASTSAANSGRRESSSARSRRAQIFSAQTFSYRFRLRDLHHRGPAPHLRRGRPERITRRKALPASNRRISRPSSASI